MIAAALRTVDRGPTEAQKAAGNYAKGHVKMHGFDVSVENPKGAMRRGIGGDGEPWAVRMPAHYGHIKRTEGADGEHLDVYIGQHIRSPHVFVVDQIDAETGEFDEHKVMLGFGSLPQARNTYLKAFSDGKGAERIGSITAMDVPRFRNWIKNEDTTKPMKPKGYAAGGRVGYADGGALPDAPWAAPAASGMSDAPWAAAQPSKPDMGRIGAFTTGLSQGATANFYDEISGASAAGNAGMVPEGSNTGVRSLPPGISHLTGLARLGYEYLTGQTGEATTAYEKARDAERERLKQAKAQYPGTTIAGEVGGALAVPGGAMMQAATLLGRMARGAAVGAGYGGLSGFGEGQGLADSATKAAIGAPVGAAVGALAPPLVEGVIQGAGALARPISNAVRGAINPDSEAARRVVSAIDRDIVTDPQALARMTPQEFVGGVNRGDPATIMDLGGETTRALARSAANTSPEGRTALNRAVNDRFESQSERVTGWLNNTFGPTDRGLTREALETAATRANNPAYRRAYREGDQPLWSDELQRLVGSPDVVAAMKSAAEKGKSRAISEGFGGFNSSVNITPSGVVEFTKGKNGAPTYPNLQFWDYTKRAIDDAARVAARAGEGGHAGVLQNLSRQLRGELDTMVPSYQSARAGAARFFGADNAVDAGEKFLTSNVPIPEAQRAFTAMSQPERELFRQSFIQSLTQKVETAGDRRNILNSIAQSPRAQQQIEMVMGPRQAREFEAMMRVEGMMDLARGAVQGNSTTARQLAELGLAGGASGVGGIGAYNMDPQQMTVAALMGALAAGSRHVDQRVARRVAEMLTSQDPRVLRQGVQAVARNQNFLNGLRATDHRITMLGAQEAPALTGPLQGALPSRAQDQQQQP